MEHSSTAHVPTSRLGGLQSCAPYQVPLFSGKQPHELAKVADTVLAVAFAEGDIVCEEGDLGHCMYVVQEGELDILVGAEREKVHRLVRGECFGEVALTADSEREGRRNATIMVSSTGGATLLRLERADFQV